MACNLFCSQLVSASNEHALSFDLGWPGTAKKIDITTRDCVAMDIDECLVPSVDPEAGNQEEDMDIDNVLLEVRQLVKSRPQVEHVECIDATGHWEIRPFNSVSLRL